MAFKLFLAFTLATIALMTSAIRADDKPMTNERFFELRTYHCHPGRLDALNTRFREHTNALFKKHGMEMIGYWIPTDQKDTLVYILAYPSREAREKSWKEFQSDPDWINAKAESEKDAPIVKKVDSVYMTPTDYSPMK
jgi:hypothetical protein